jgi:hypothetical protein
VTEELASGLLHPSRQSLGLLKDLVGDGNCGFHTLSITKLVHALKSLTFSYTGARGPDAGSKLSHCMPLPERRLSKLQSAAKRLIGAN